MRQNLGAILKNADNSQIIDLAYSLQSTKILHPITNVKMLVEPFSQNVAIWMQHESIQFQQNPHHELKSPQQTFDFFKKMIQEEEFIKLEKKKKEELVRHLLELNKINKDTMDNFIALQKMSQQERKLAREAIDKIFDGKELNQKELKAANKHLFGQHLNVNELSKEHKELNIQALILANIYNEHPNEKMKKIDSLLNNAQNFDILKQMYPHLTTKEDIKQELQSLKGEQIVDKLIQINIVKKSNNKNFEMLSPEEQEKIITQSTIQSIADMRNDIDNVSKQYLNETKNKLAKNQNNEEQKNNAEIVNEATSSYRNLSISIYKNQRNDINVETVYSNTLNNKPIETLKINTQFSIDGKNLDGIDLQTLEKAALIEKERILENNNQQLTQNQQFKL